MLAYVGVALALAAGWVALLRISPDLDGSGWLVATGFATAATLPAGRPFRRHPEPALARLGGVLWLLSAGCSLWAGGFVIFFIQDSVHAPSLFWLGVTCSVYAAILVALRPDACPRSTTSGVGSRAHRAAGSRTPQWLTGSAAKHVEERLSRKGYEVIGAQTFFVETTGGPLADGERERAVA